MTAAVWTPAGNLPQVACPQGVQNALLESTDFPSNFSNARKILLFFPSLKRVLGCHGIKGRAARQKPMTAVKMYINALVSAEHRHSRSAYTPTFASASVNLHSLVFAPLMSATKLHSPFLSRCDFGLYGSRGWP